MFILIKKHRVILYGYQDTPINLKCVQQNFKNKMPELEMAGGFLWVFLDIFIYQYKNTYSITVGIIKDKRLSAKGVISFCFIVKFDNLA